MASARSKPATAARVVAIGSTLPYDRTRSEEEPMSQPRFTLIDDGEPRAVPEGPAELTALAARLGRPLALDPEERAAYLGISASVRGERLRSREAPDFTLPDLAGRPHALRDHRGQKVFLVAYGSW
jgi:hypothetical protein